MQVLSRSTYEVAQREIVAEGADLRVQILTLAGGQCVPWHYHSAITDSFVCLEGPMVVETRAPRNSYRLEPGQRCAVPPKTAHYVHGEDDGACKFLVIQGSGSTISCRSAEGANRRAPAAPDARRLCQRRDWP